MDLIATLVGSVQSASKGTKDFIQGKPSAFSRSSKWPAMQKLIVSKHPYCIACGCKTKKLLNVHHIYPFHLFPELELEELNLIVLCEGAGINCHFAFGHLLDWKAYNPQVIKDASDFFFRKTHRLYLKATPSI